MQKIVQFSAIALLIIVLASCKKENNGRPGVIDTGIGSYSDTVVMYPLQRSGNSIIIRWSRLVGHSDFYYYQVLRRSYKCYDHEHYSESDVIATIGDSTTTQCVVDTLPYCPYLEYQVVGVCYYKKSGTPPGHTYYFSQPQTVERPYLKSLLMFPIDVIPDPDHHRMFVIESFEGKIDVIDYKTNSITHSIKTNTKNGYGCLATFNGTLELYVPNTDGKVVIYNAETLQTIDWIDVSGWKSVICNDGKLFVFYSHSVCVIDRATKTQISRAIFGSFSPLLRVVPGSRTKIYGTYENSPFYYLNFSLEFDAAGNYLTCTTKVSSNLQEYDLFEVFPDGQHFLFMSEGDVYNQDLTFLLTLPHSNQLFSRYAFTRDGSKILAGCRNAKEILAYSNPGYTEVKKYSTGGYPVFIFCDADNNIISLSSFTSFESSTFPTYYFLETIPTTL
jgi:hypothetical protein